MLSLTLEPPYIGTSRHWNLPTLESRPTLEHAYTRTSLHYSLPTPEVPYTRCSLHWNLYTGTSTLEPYYTAPPTLEPSSNGTLTQ